MLAGWFSSFFVPSTLSFFIWRIADDQEEVRKGDQRPSMAVECHISATQLEAGVTGPCYNDLNYIRPIRNPDPDLPPTLQCIYPSSQP